MFKRADTIATAAALSDETQDALGTAAWAALAVFIVVTVACFLACASRHDRQRRQLRNHK